jgi:hypothetical protein
MGGHRCKSCAKWSILYRRNSFSRDFSIQPKCNKITSASEFYPRFMNFEDSSAAIYCILRYYGELTFLSI